MKHTGGSMSPFTAWMHLNGMATLDLRCRAMAETALTVARALEGDARLSKVIYPGLASHPQHALAMGQMGSGGTLIAFDIKGGKEAAHSNDAIYAAIKSGLGSTEIPVDAVQLVSTRDEIASLLALDKYIDLVIPRGSKQLVQYIQANTRIPVLGHADGICSIFVDESADIAKCAPVIVDAKVTFFL